MKNLWKKTLLTTVYILDSILYYLLCVLLLYSLFSAIFWLYIYFSDNTEILFNHYQISCHLCAPSSEENISDSNSFFYTIRNTIKRKFVWYIIESGNAKYSSYNEFKSSWDPNFDLYGYVKHSVKEDLLHKINVHRKTLKYFINTTNPRNVK